MKWHLGTIFSLSTFVLDRQPRANSVAPDQAKENTMSDHYFRHINTDTLQPLYNMVHYNMVLDITWFKDGSQKCIDYIEK